MHLHTECGSVHVYRYILLLCLPVTDSHSVTWPRSSCPNIPCIVYILVNCLTVFFWVAYVGHFCISWHVTTTCWSVEHCESLHPHAHEHVHPRVLALIENRLQSIVVMVWSLFSFLSFFKILFLLRYIFTFYNSFSFLLQHEI